MAVSSETVEKVRARCKGRCEYCGDRELYGNPLELHHMLIHRAKNKPELDCEYNLMAVHKTPCHSRSNSYAERKKFWAKQTAHYSEEVMRRWWNSLPSKSRKEQFG